jgi:hypothetical protein
VPQRCVSPPRLNQRASMISFVARGLLIVAMLVAGWFIWEDPPELGLVPAAIELLLLGLVVSVIAFWPKRWTAPLDRRDEER